MRVDHPVSVSGPVFSLLITVTHGRTKTSKVISFLVRSKTPLGRGQLPRAEPPGQDEGSHVRPLRELQRRQEGRLQGPARGAAELWTGVRQLLASWRTEGLFSSAQRCARQTSHLQRGLGGNHQVRAPLLGHQELAVLQVPRGGPAPVLLQGLQDRHVRVSRDPVSL